MATIALLGMHRSGTSALARTLGDLGAWLGSPEYVTRRSEHALVQECNQEILNSLGGHWSAPPVFEPGWIDQPELGPIDAQARAAVADLVARPLSMWKDPRNSFTLPYWRERLPEPPVVVVSYRHPMEVAGSLEARNHFGPGHAVALWEAYNRASLESAAGLPTIFVGYADLVADPIATLESVCERLGGVGIDVDAQRCAQAAGAVDTGRRHHVHHDLPDGATTPQQRMLWHALCALPPVSDAFTPPVLDAPHVTSTELLAQRAAAIRLERRLGEAQSELRSRRALARNLVRRLMRAGKA